MAAFRRRLATAVLAASAALLASCAVSPSGEGASSAAPAAAGFDVAAKFAMPHRERGRRDRAAMNARYQLETEADESGPPTAAQLFRAHEQRHALEREAATGARAKVAGLRANRWESLGPSNVGGRVRALAFDPRNASRVLAGTASGGVWITEDAGASWRANTDFLPNLSISTIVFDAVDRNVAYLGTGEASAGLVGVGVFKSVDSGATWQYLGATNPDTNADWRFVNRVAAHPRVAGTLLAAVTNNNLSTGGIYRSVDGGASWVRAASLRALDIAFDPSNPARALAGLDDGTLAWSADGGASWTRTAALVASPSGRGNTARAEIAFARTVPGLVYASVDEQKGQVWRSRDSGATWELASTPGHLGGQGDYDNAIWVDPLDGNHVVVAGLDIHDSRDGGTSFIAISNWRAAPSSPHADHHALVSPPDYGPGNPALWNGNDGGVYRAASIFAASAAVPGGWTNLNNGLAATQFYGGAGRTAAGGRIVGGTQDNGSLMLSQGTWRPVRGGDGGFVAVDPTTDNYAYGEYVYLAIHRSVNGGTASYICAGLTEGLPDGDGATYCGAGATKQANFIAPFVLDPSNPNRMLAGANSLWVNDNARGVPTWRTIKSPSAASENYINAITVHERSSDVIWVGHNNGEVYRTREGTAVAPSWSRVGQGVLPSRRVQRILVDRDDANRAIVAYTGFVADNVWQTTDGGATWRSITGNLPFAPVFDVKRHPARPQWLYVATSVGVFATEDGGASWSTTNDGPANIRVRELFWLDDATLGAATYGRGMFKATVPAGGPGDYQDLWWAGTAENGWGMSITQHGSTIFAALYVYDASGRPVWYVLPGGRWDASFTTFSGSLYAPSGSWFGAYDTSRFSAGDPVGSASIAFTGTGTAVLDYAIAGATGRKVIQRQAFGPRDTTPVGSYGDLWWGGTAQNGWGVAISQQYRTLFAVWYTYDEQGRTLWYVVPGGAWTTAGTFTGTAYRTRGAPWIGVPYDPSAFGTTPAGTVTFTFQDLEHAVMTYSVDGVTQSRAIVRQPF